MDAHPLADLLPAMAPTEYDALKADIARHGIHEPIWTYSGLILDGRHRERACRELGIACPAHYYDGDDPHGFVVSMNIHRRHLNVSQRRELIAKLLQAAPEKSDRAIAEVAKTDHKTVAAVRKVLESGGEFPHHEKRIGKDGAKQAASKGAPQSTEAPITGRGKPVAERIKEIEALAAAGNNPEQMAEVMGVNVRTVRGLIFDNKIKVTTQTLSPRGRSALAPLRVLEQTVYSLSGLAQGLRIIRNKSFVVPREQAIALLDEARTAMATINSALSKLREIANG